VRRDLRYAGRSLRANPVFTAVVVLTLALGLGAATAMFSVADAVLLRDLPVREQDRVVMMHSELREDASVVAIPFADVEAFREGARTLQAVAGVQYDGAWPAPVLDGDEAFPVTTGAVTAGYFEVLGARAAVGRLLRDADGEPGADPVAVISHGLWRSRYGSDPGIVGRTLRFAASGSPLTVVGVAPEGFEFPAGTELWIPLPRDAALLDSRFAPFSMVGRLRPGATPGQARAELQAFFRERQATVYGPSEPRDQRAVVRPFRDAVLGGVRQPVVMLAAAVGLLLVLVCMNVATLLLIRGTRRRGEFAVRAALGAERAVLARLVLAEGGFLAVLGGVLGVVLALAMTRGLVALAPPEIPRLDAVRLDGRAVLFAVLAAGATTLLASLVPAWWVVRAELGRSLRGGGRGGAEGRGVALGKQALVVAQVALAVVILAGAGLLVRSLRHLQTVDMGIASEELAVAGVSLPRSRYASPADQLAFHERLAERLQALPGIVQATPVMTGPFDGDRGWNTVFAVEGQGEREAGANPALAVEAAEPDYFATLGIRMLRGRGFAPGDGPDGVPVVVVSRSMAARAWPGQDPLGKRIRLGGAGSQTPWRVVVGVAEDVRYRSLEDPPPGVYVPFRQSDYTPEAIALRFTRALPSAEIRAAARNLERDARVLEIAAVSDLMAGPLARPRLNAWLLTFFAAISLVLSALGLYGVMSTWVAQRTRELGVRMALGAQAATVRRMILGQGAVLAAVGIVLGLAASLLLSELLASMLFGVRPTDPATFAAAAAVLLATTLLACLVPARRATRIDPMEVLREG
jgi:predicted permease